MILFFVCQWLLEAHERGSRHKLQGTINRCLLIPFELVTVDNTGNILLEELLKLGMDPIVRDSESRTPLVCLWIY